MKGIVIDAARFRVGTVSWNWRQLDLEIAYLPYPRGVGQD